MVSGQKRRAPNRGNDGRSTSGCKARKPASKVPRHPRYAHRSLPSKTPLINRERYNENDDDSVLDEGFEEQDTFLEVPPTHSANGDKPPTLEELQQTLMDDELFEKRTIPTLARLRNGAIYWEKEDEVKIEMEYRVKTAFECPCEDSLCTKLINYGKYAVFGGGARACPHCKKHRGDNADGWSSYADFKQHLNTGACRKARGLAPQTSTAAHRLSDSVRHSVNDPAHKVVLVVDGLSKELFRCPACQREDSSYRSRYKHVETCYPRHQRSLR